MKFKSFIKRIDKIVRIYTKGRFKVVEIHANKQLAPVLDEYTKDKNIRTNYVRRREHVPRAEMNNRVIKERVRCIYYQLPYNHLPKMLIEYITFESTKKLNFFLACHSVSKYYNLRMILR